MEIDMPDENSVEAIARRDSHSKRNSENIKKRLSQIEVEINEMNDLLTENIDITQKMMIEDETRVEDNGSTEETREEEDGKRDSELPEGEDEEEDESGKEQEDEIKDDENIEKDNHQLDNMEKIVIKSPAESKETADSFLEIEDKENDSSEEIESEQQLLQDILDTPFNFSAVSGTDEFVGPGRVRRASSNYSNRSSSPSSSVKDKIESIEANNKPLEHEVIVDAQLQEETVPQISNYKRRDNTASTNEGKRVVSNSVKSPFRVVSVSRISGNRSSSDLTQQNKEQKQKQEKEQEKEKEITVGNKKDNNTSFVQESINTFNNMRDSFIAHSEIDKKKNKTNTSKTLNNEQELEFEKPKKMTVSSLQLVYDHLDAKINKVEREIEYLNKILMKGGLNLSDSKKLQEGIQKLENYLDKKIKLRHEIGVKLSRKLRHKIEMGENEGIFFSGKI